MLDKKEKQIRNKIAMDKFKKLHPTRMKELGEIWRNKHPDRYRWHIENYKIKYNSDINFRNKCLARNKKLYKNHPEKYNKEYFNDRDLVSRFGINMEEKRKMIKKQNNKCKICNKLLTKPCIDHCHKTKKIRGILCNHCNNVLGFSFDNPKILQNAIKYLKKYERVTNEKTK